MRLRQTRRDRDPPAPGTKPSRPRDAASRRRELAEIAISQGWHVEQTKSGHWRFIPPDTTKRIVVLPGTSVSRSGMRNALADLRRSGLIVARDESPQRDNARPAIQSHYVRLANDYDGVPLTSEAWYVFADQLAEAGLHRLSRRLISITNRWRRLDRSWLAGSGSWRAGSGYMREAPLQGMRRIKLYRTVATEDDRLKRDIQKALQISPEQLRAPRYHS